MVDIQFATAEIRRGKTKKERQKKQSYDTAAIITYSERKKTIFCQLRVIDGGFMQ